MFSRICCGGGHGFVPKPCPQLCQSEHPFQFMQPEGVISVESIEVVTTQPRGMGVWKFGEKPQVSTPPHSPAKE